MLYVPRINILNELVIVVRYTQWWNFLKITSDIASATGISTELGLGFPIILTLD
jgi:hypothetical protein